MTKRGHREEEMIALVRRVCDAFNRGDFDEAAKFAGDNFELQRIGGLGTVLRGREALRAWMEPDAWDEQRWDPKDFRVNGNRLLVRTHNRARGRGSGIELDAEFYSVWTFDDDLRPVRIEAYTANQREQALGAAGLPLD